MTLRKLPFTPITSMKILLHILRITLLHALVHGSIGPETGLVAAAVIATAFQEGVVAEPVFVVALYALMLEEMEGKR